MDNWRLVITEPLSGAMNMAVDEAILKAVSDQQAPPTIRFYQWNPPAVSIGYFQKMDKEVDVPACKNAGIDVVRRLTGGRAVLHKQEFTYSLTASDDCPKIAGSVLQSYMAISQGLIQGLFGLGIRAELAEGKKHSEHISAACFDAPSWYEMVVDGKKLIGSAQTRRNGCILQHGSLPLDSEADLLFSVLRFNNDRMRERAMANFLQKAADLKGILGYLPAFSQISEAFKKGFEKALKIRLDEQELSSFEVELSQELCEKKYETAEWNRR